LETAPQSGSGLHNYYLLPNRSVINVPRANRPSPQRAKFEKLSVEEQLDQPVVAMRLADEMIEGFSALRSAIDNGYDGQKIIKAIQTWRPYEDRIWSFDISGGCDIER
jgi:hypothetical protein